ncbi:3-hydroxybutyryl-CoA dehydrogenase [Peptococcaceae bacterium SCADC1_2_3]|jgi:3-hydroxybutyryl-CoA dehydrogenase|nr:3-hydroxybutyryl-CoA dehydrogenase [Peptococcaceae bacterium SCADC1_2_3]KFI35518.1 3-hydroxybutyryl-CoA dehydrogenase [Peptococcaceae bacterium SCADC1_2_3]HBQ28048.1 3-hydroxybutyryl-CoA dehydrogenase [Desulfotomaculum sp.]HCJ79633.1 3-hydroxybutyryl-CoA dehydrogenase [Desulfotomaculum sp.]
MEIKKMMVIGAGQMGGGIAQVGAAVANIPVLLNDISEEFINKGLKVIEGNLSRDVKKGRMDETRKEAILKNIIPALSLKEAKNVDLVVEAAIENMEIKGNLFKELDEVCPPHTILATNTSTLPITEIAAFTKRPEKVIGMHFMNPVPVMQLVEVIRGLATSDETYEVIKAMSEKMGKTPVVVNDSPGFVSNRVLMPMINEAIYCVYEGIGTPEAVDAVMKLGMNHPMGPLALADLIGLDTTLYVIEILYKGLGDSKYRPCPLLRKYVAAGWLGRKTGRGFYKYDK